MQNSILENLLFFLKNFLNTNLGSMAQIWCTAFNSQVLHHVLQLEEVLQGPTWSWFYVGFLFHQRTFSVMLYKVAHLKSDPVANLPTLDNFCRQCLRYWHFEYPFSFTSHVVLRAFNFYLFFKQINSSSPQKDYIRYQKKEESSFYKLKWFTCI